MMNYSNEIISNVAYLIGLEENRFGGEGNEKAFANIETFRELERNKAAKIVRSLCIMRNGFMNNFTRILSAIQGNSGLSAGIHGLYEYIGQENVVYLENAGIRFKYTSKARDYIIEINRYISDRIGNCKNLFPEYMDWNFVKDLFIMPNGLSDEGCKMEGEKFVANKSCYPFCCYMNWKRLDEARGKALFNDYNFMSALYADNGKQFDRKELVTCDSDANCSRVMEFLIDKETDIVVDCENANPFFIYSFLNGIDDDSFNQIRKVILFTDPNASTAWKILNAKFPKIEFEEITCERVVDRKSLVDIRLVSRTVREYYQNNIRSFIIVSSDSDFCGMLHELPEAEFMFVLERHQTSIAMLNEVTDKGLTYIYAEDYSYSDAYDFKKAIVVGDFRKEIETHWEKLNFKRIIDEIAEKTFANLSEQEKESMLQCICKRMRFKDSGGYEMEIVIE